MSSTSVKIIWQKLNNHDSNGVITQYKVCYEVSENPTDISCNFKQIVDGNTTEVILNGLLEATTYNVAVQAATAAGFGPLGPVIIRKTMEDSKYPYENLFCTILFQFFCRIGLIMQDKIP